MSLSPKYIFILCDSLIFVVLFFFSSIGRLLLLLLILVLLLFLLLLLLLLVILCRARRRGGLPGSAVFSYMTAPLSEAFFPGDDPVSATMSTFTVFAGAFFMRPLGGLIFGHIGDTIGRRRALLAAIILMVRANTKRRN